jgi:hypothetical protein
MGMMEAKKQRLKHKIEQIIRDSSMLAPLVC